MMLAPDGEAVMAMMEALALFTAGALILTGLYIVALVLILLAVARWRTPTKKTQSTEEMESQNPPVGG